MSISTITSSCLPARSAFFPKALSLKTAMFATAFFSMIPSSAADVSASTIFKYGCYLICMGWIIQEDYPCRQMCGMV